MKNKEFIKKKIKIHIFNDTKDDYIYAGKSFGDRCRKIYEIDKKDKDNELYEIYFDNTTKIINSSFIISMFYDSVKRLGLPKFSLKYQFNFDNIDSLETLDGLATDIACAYIKLLNLTYKK